MNHVDIPMTIASFIVDIPPLVVHELTAAELACYDSDAQCELCEKTRHIVKNRLHIQL